VKGCILGHVWVKAELTAPERIRADDDGPVPQPKPSLTTLAQLFHTDKWDVHRYTPYYERHFAQFVGQSVNVLEIGIGGYGHTGAGGASLLMWKSYFPKGNIVGLDIHDKSFLDQERVKTIVGDQGDEATLRKIAAEAGPLNIVIDDSSHRPPDVIKSFNVLFPLLASDGIYVIEDTQTSYWPEWDDALDTEARERLWPLLSDSLTG
jgi:hypothetical protein